jgi:glycine/D-amino acid oxidase-like deaminating enzyme
VKKCDKSAESHLAGRLREVAEKTANPEDRELLRHTAGFLDNPKLAVRLVFRDRSKSRWRERFERAKRMNEYCQKHGVTLELAQEAAARGDLGQRVSARTARAHWQEFKDVVKLSERDQATWLFFKNLEAQGLARIERVARELPQNA